MCVCVGVFELTRVLSDLILRSDGLVNRLLDASFVYYFVYVAKLATAENTNASWTLMEIGTLQFWHVCQITESPGLTL